MRSTRMRSHAEALDDQVHQEEQEHYHHQQYQEQLENELGHPGGGEQQLDEFGQEEGGGEEGAGDVELNIPPHDQLQQHDLDLQLHQFQHLDQHLHLDELGNPLDQHDHGQQEEGDGESNQAHLLLDDLPPSSSTSSSVYDHTLCKYVLGGDDGEGCYGKLFETRQEALTFVTTSIKSLEGVDPRTIDFKVSRCAVPDHVWRAVMDSELAKGTGYVEIAVELDTGRAAKRGGSKRKKAKLSHPKTKTNLTASVPNSHLDHLSQPPNSTSYSSDSSTFNLQPNHFLPRPAHYPPLGTNTNIHILPSLPTYLHQHQPQPQPQPSYASHPEIDDLEPEGGYGNDDEFPQPLNKDEDEDLDLSLLPDEDDDEGVDGDETNSLDGTNDDNPQIFLPAGLLHLSEPIGLAEEQQLNAWNLPSSVYQQMVTAAGGFGGAGNAEASGSGSGGLGGEVGEGGGAGTKKKRKPSRYNVFYGTEYLRLKSEHPDMENTQIIREVARLWGEEPSNPKNAKGRKPREERPPTLYTEYYHIEYARLKRENPNQSNEDRNRVVAVNWAASPVNPKTRKRKRKTLLIEPRTEGYLHSPSGGATEAAVMAARMQSQEVEGYTRRFAELAEAEGGGGGGSVEGNDEAEGGHEEQHYSHPNNDDDGGEQPLEDDDQQQQQQDGEGEPDPSTIHYDLDPSLVDVDLTSTHPHQILQLDPQLVEELGDLDPQLVGMGLPQQQYGSQHQEEDSALGMDMEGLRQLHRMQQEHEHQALEDGQGGEQQEQSEGDQWGDL